MKQLSLSIATVAMAMFAASCGQPTSQGQLVGDYSNRMNYKAPAPVGMVFVEAGVLKSGYSDQDIQNSMDAPVRTFNMTGFYMDATEITNAEYRQFTNWVRDSIAHTILGDFKDNDDGTQTIDWANRLKWSDPDVQDQLMGMYIDATQTGTGKKELDVSKLEYVSRKFDLEGSIMNPGQPRTSFDIKKSVKVYPDTTVWMKQFAYSNNEPITRQYNWFPAFDEYPVVGVNWIQAGAFCNWRTLLWKGEREKRKLYFEGEFQLPTESQWEWAARGGRQLSPYPWGGPYTMNQKGCYLANFKPNRGDYSADGGLYTVRANAYWPNDYGLYNMSGNVAEWTRSIYVRDAYNVNMLSDMNPDIRARLSETDPAWQRRIVVKGGSWRDPAPYLNVSYRDYEFADTAKAYIGFRCVYEQVYGGITNNSGRASR
ncbi:T9SS ring complex lipoprotein PorK/GldK [Taibaiella helva]|uniref:type IX secretion system lipoprotein PorK/GldK n=1 Tax=Taibaiella helva TaxID=2301235 RepID=UPI000E58FDD0|nr:SUMF1/EgtB/PvdO family nonheme iron enzyme [Taibaiella helva]